MATDKSSKPTGSKSVQCHCPKCGPDRRALVRGEEEQSSSEEFGPARIRVDFSETYRILECAGCETMFCQRVLWDSDSHDPREEENGAEVSYWPSMTVWKTPNWLVGIQDCGLRHIFDELYLALNNEMPISAATLIRTAFDRSSKLLGVGPGLPFAKKLDQIRELGKIGDNEREMLGVLVDAGSAAAHRGWRPSNSELSTMLRILEAFIEKAFVLNTKANNLASTVPVKPPPQEGN